MNRSGPRGHGFPSEIVSRTDLVVAVDGVNSRLRAQLFPDHPVPHAAGRSNPGAAGATRGDAVLHYDIDELVTPLPVSPRARSACLLTRPTP